MKKNTFFSLAVFITIIIIIKIGDFFLQKTGLGHQVIYYNSFINGYSLKPNQEVKRMGNIIKINNKGMRSNYDWNSDHKNSILFIGDSITYGGSIVSNDDLFTEKICNKINISKNIHDKYLCGNYAANGYSITSIKNKLKYYKNFNNEKFVVIVLAKNDFYRNFHNIYSQPFFTRKIDSFFPALTELYFYIVYKAYRKKYTYVTLDHEKLHDEHNKYPLFLQNEINELHRFFLENNKTVIVIYSPELNEISNNIKNNYVKKILSEKFDNFIDMSSEFSLLNFSDYFYDHIHLNKKGHELYSEVISNYIKKNNFLKN